MPINGINNTYLYNKNYKSKKADNVNIGCINNADNNISFASQPKADTFQKTTQNYKNNQITDTTSLKQDLEKTKSEQGFLGKLWDGFKNLTGIGAGSSKAQQAIEDYENGLITAEEMQKAVDGYKEGQKMAVDVIADMASGMASIVAFGAATALMGPAGALLVAGTVGVASKVGIKAGDALIGGREYSGKDLLYDGITGGINGLLGPITNGIGNTVTKTIAAKFGTTVLKEGAEELAEQGIKQGFKQFAKNVVLNQSDDFIGGTLKQRAIALGAGMATDGALGGASDNMVRAALEGEDILKAGAEGFVGGLIMAPIIGGGMKLAGKAGKALNDKILKNATKQADNAFNLNSSLARDYIEAINKAIKEGKIDKLSSEKLQIALELLDPNSASSKKLTELSKKLYDQLISENYQSTKNVANEFAKALGIEGSFVKVEGEDLFVLKNDGVGVLSARPKGTDSIFSKGRNKVVQLKENFPTTLEELVPMIADAQGVRFVFDSSAKKINDGDIIELLGSDLAEGDVDGFIKYIRNIQKPSDENLVKYRELEKKLYEKVLKKSDSANSFCKSFAEAIKKGDVRITELHNYSSLDGIPYLNQEHVDMISEAYESWYKARYNEALNKTGLYEIKLDEYDIEYLVDNKGNKFRKSLLIETISNNDKKAIKSNGYTAAQFNLVSNDGDLVEFQYRGSEIDGMAESEHIVYDCKKNKDSVAGEDYREVREIINKIKNIKGAMEAYDRYFNDVFKARRKLELGIYADMPKIEDYLKLSAELSESELKKIDANGIEKLHQLIKSKRSSKNR